MARRKESNSIDSLFERLGRDFEAIRLARSQSAAMLSKLKGIADDAGAASPQLLRLPPPDASIVLLGSLARDEFTAGSDVDWTLLLDGQADPKHKDAAREFRRRLTASGIHGPNPAGAFGGLAFSHELIHCIGGEHDTNANMTKRILLLLESRSLSTADAHYRVLRGILERYVVSERSFLAESGLRFKIPRFLLNDIVRYWRTMAVDYVSKQWERGDHGWALRNIKLRFSRKLTFVSGLLLCFRCYLESKASEGETLLRDREQAKRTVLQHLTIGAGRPPMDLLCEHLMARAKPETSIRLLAAYDKFLAMLNDVDRRNHLDQLSVEAAYSDLQFAELRKLSHQFQEGLNQMFFHDDPDVQMLMSKYGIF